MSKENSVEPLENPNNRVWEKICETDPFRTKSFNKGYRGTAINPTYIYEKLTRCFGPCGTGWGFDIIKDEYKNGYDKEISHSITVALWYKNEGNRSEPICGIGGTAYVFKDKNGWHTDEDASKKSLTDALTKAAQLLGMSADIFSGLYDDCKYVAELKKKYNSKEEKTDTQEKTSTTQPTEQEQEAPQGKSGSSPNGKKVTKAQGGLLWHKFTESRFSQEDIEVYCQYHYSAKDNNDLPMSAVKVILALFDKGELRIVAKKTDDIPF